MKECIQKIRYSDGAVVARQFVSGRVSDPPRRKYAADGGYHPGGIIDDEPRRITQADIDALVLALRQKEVYKWCERRMQEEANPLAAEKQRYNRVRALADRYANRGIKRTYAQIAAELGLPPAQPTRYSRPSIPAAEPARLSAEMLRRIDQRIAFNQAAGKFQKFDAIVNDIRSGH